MIKYKQRKKKEKNRMNKKTAESLGVVHAHTHIFIKEQKKKQLYR